jgi:electron transport complex protein RnfB
MAPSVDGVAIAVILSALAAMSIIAFMQRRARMPLAHRIDAILPQTQCAQCGYAGCMPYAQAIARGEAAINRCPPGGDALIRKIARLTARPYLGLDQSCGIDKPRQAALIDEARCIGCTLCIQACPVDAIVGAPKLMHTIIASECTGCELCLAPCPVDCITLEPAPWASLQLLLGAKKRAAERARNRFQARNQRIERERRERAQRLSAKSDATDANPRVAADAAGIRKQAIVKAAIERARLKLATPTAHR